MKVKHIKSGEVYEVNGTEFYDSVTSKGYGYKFQILEEDLPIEVRTIRQKKAELNIPETVAVKSKIKTQK